MDLRSLLWCLRLRSDSGWGLGLGLACIVWLTMRQRTGRIRINVADFPIVVS